MAAEMNYDETDQAQRYDRARAISVEARRQWLAPLRRFVSRPAPLVVDLACGTGRFTGGLARELEARVVGVDAAATMLAKAVGNVADARVAFVRADAAAIPLAAGAADVVFVSMAWHHFDDPAAVAAEIRRVLRSGGILAIRNAMTDTLDEVPYLPFFPGARRQNLERLPARGPLTALAQSAGFRRAHHDVIVMQMAESWAAYGDKVGMRAYSDLAVLDDAEFEAGMAALRAHAAPAGPVLEPVDYFIFAASG